MNHNYKILRAIAKGVFSLLFRIKVKGYPQNVPEGGCLFCANHLSAIDPALIAISTNRQLWFLAKAELVKVPLVNILVKKFGIPVTRGTADLAAIRTCVAAIKEGKNLLVFPQGTRRKGVEPKMTEVKHGSAMFIHRAKCPVIPVYIEAKNYKIGLFKKITITFGKQINYEDFGFTRGSLPELESASELLWKSICDLCEKEKGTENGN